MYRNILIPIVFEKDATPEPAFAVARLLAAEGAHVTVLHVIEEPPAFAIEYMPDGYAIDLERAITQEVKDMATTFPNGAGIVLHGHPGRTILEWAENNGTDCIVITSHRPGLQDYVLGSTASRVVRHAQCAVHVLR